MTFRVIITQSDDNKMIFTKGLDEDEDEDSENNDYFHDWSEWK